jgi:hypothetical protein
MPTTSLSDSTLKDRSLAAFRRFEEVWEFNDFWKRGNTFDACLTFVDAAMQRWPGDSEVVRMQRTVTKMLEVNLAFFARFDPGGLWADDFGWWGLMALNARRHLKRRGEHALAEQYLALSINLCWEYKRKTAYDLTPDAKPVPHGCRNGDANGVSRGVKNTVTNVLLFLLSSRICRTALADARAPEREHLAMAWAQWQWFSRWFTLEEYQYLKKLSPSAALVQERPMARFDGSDYQETVHPPWAEGWIWTGDQGMLIAALADMLALKDALQEWLNDTGTITASFEADLRRIIATLGNGIASGLVGASDGIFREAPCLSSFGPNHGNDYLAGRGIMMRYLGDPAIAALTGIDLPSSIEATADALWRTRDASHDQFQPEFTSEPNDRLYIAQYNKLMGAADNVRVWDLQTMDEQQKHGVCQSIGLDALGAAIRLPC